jgi:hypothetical protein
MKFNVVYDRATGVVKRWSNVSSGVEIGESVIESSKNLFGKKWKVDLNTFAITEVIPGKTWGEIRTVRDALLAQSDFINNADYPMTQEKRSAARAYRQALRDLTKTYASPDEVVWPVNPI